MTRVSWVGNTGLIARTMLIKKPLRWPAYAGCMLSLTCTETLTLTLLLCNHSTKNVNTLVSNFQSG
jgi:hypothetical protein